MEALTRKERSMPGLKEELAAFKTKFAATNDPSVVDAYEKGIEELRAAGLERNALKRGDPAPDFTLPDATGTPVSLAARLREGPVVLKFYRGGWCPYCNLELRAWQRALPELRALGAQLIAVSPETPDNSLSTQEKNALSFTVLTDEGSKVAGAYRLAFRLSPELQALYESRGRNLAEWNGGDWTLPVPGTFVIGKDQRVALAFVDADYRTRLEPSSAIDAVRKLAPAVQSAR
jgi:peroxiredoxin